MLIATIVFGPFAGAAAAAVIGKKSEKAGEYAALFLTLCILGLSPGDPVRERPDFHCHGIQGSLCRDHRAYVGRDYNVLPGILCP